MNTSNTSKSLYNLEKHQIGIFPIPLSARRETFEETLNLLDPENGPDVNSSYLTRSTRLYKITSEDFENLSKLLSNKQCFVQVEILHSSSDTGQPYQLFIRHESGKVLYYDGLFYRLTETVHDDDFCIDELHKFTKYSPGFDPIVDEFEKSLVEVIPLLNIGSHMSRTIYTASIRDWIDIGIKATDDIHLCVTLKDMNVLTITASRFFETGANYCVYIGERESTLQMLANETVMLSELRSFSNFFEEQNKRLNVLKDIFVKELNRL